MKEKEVGIMVKEKKEGGLELHLFPSKEAMARWRGKGKSKVFLNVRCKWHPQITNKR